MVAARWSRVGGSRTWCVGCVAWWVVGCWCTVVSAVVRGVVVCARVLEGWQPSAAVGGSVTCAWCWCVVVGRGVSGSSSPGVGAAIVGDSSTVDCLGWLHVITQKRR